MKPVHIQKRENQRYIITKPSSAPPGQASCSPTVTIDTPEELGVELQALGFPEQVINDARQLREGGELMLILDTIWATAVETGGVNIGVTGDPIYGGPIHAANEDELQQVLAGFIGEHGSVTRAAARTIIEKTSSGQRYETQPAYLYRLNELRRYQPPASHKG